MACLQIPLTDSGNILADCLRESTEVAIVPRGEVTDDCFVSGAAVLNQGTVECRLTSYALKHTVQQSLYVYP